MTNLSLDRIEMGESVQRFIGFIAQSTYRKRLQVQKLGM
jgi:hypothetical protein